MKYLNSFYLVETIKYSEGIVRENIKSRINFRADVVKQRAGVC